MNGNAPLCRGGPRFNHFHINEKMGGNNIELAHISASAYNQNECVCPFRLVIESNMNSEASLYYELQLGCEH